MRFADELFLSSTNKNVAPVTQLDGQPVGDGHPGPVTRRLMVAFDRYIDARLEAIDKARLG